MDRQKMGQRIVGRCGVPGDWCWVIGFGDESQILTVMAVIPGEWCWSR